MTATLSAFEYAARHFEPPRRRWATPGDVARELDPRTVQTRALDLIDAELVALKDTPDGRLIITMAPQEGKSLRVARDFPIWWLDQDPDARVVVASYSQDLANRNGKAIRRAITDRLSFPHRLAPDNGAAHDWTLDGHLGGVFSVGVGGGLTGRPADVMVIDDPIKNQQEADSEAFRENVWDWMTGVVYARLAPGAPVVVILTRWHELDLAGRLLAEADGDWRVLNIPAQSDHRPELGETDILGREPGDFMDSTRRRSRSGWERRKREAGSRNWSAQYQGRPSPPEGGMFKRDQWQRYDQPQWIERPDGARIVPGVDSTDMLASWDLTFKDTKGTDYVAAGVWLRRGAQCHLLDLVHGRWDFVETCRQFRALSARWPQVILKVVEDKANGPAVIAALKRTVPGIVPEEPQGSKTARAAACTPLVEAGQVFLPSSELLPLVDELIEECAGFPHAAHDDYVDQLSQALNRLILQPLLDQPPDPDDFRPASPAWASPY